MNKENIIKVALTVVLASSIIVGGTYAYGIYNKANDPLAVTSDFYQEWLEYQGNPLADNFYQGHSALSQEFQDKIFRIVSGFDKGGFDPVLLAQDKPSGIQMEASRVSDRVAVVTVFETFGDNQKELKVDLVKQGWRWEIIDIRDAEAVDSQPLASTIDLQNKVGDYIRDNISELSPEEAVLGGTFYVTEITFGAGNLVEVEYEDGHIALQAEARYELLPDDSVRVIDFTVISE